VRYGHHFREYCKVRPGITGCGSERAQQPSYRRRVALDVIYVKRRNIALNSMILARTLPAVLLQRGSC
jgi:exopolysaccharide production protein ExoY